MAESGYDVHLHSEEILADPELEALESRERAFLHELVLGTLRRRGWLDHVLSGLVSRPLARACRRRCRGRDRR